MALKVLLLRKKLTDLQTALAEKERAAEAFITREAELAAAIEEAATDEERTVVEAAVEEFDAERQANTAGKGKPTNALHAVWYGNSFELGVIGKRSVIDCTHTIPVDRFGNTDMLFVPRV